MRVVADVISNRTAVVVDETNALVAGDNAAFLIDPRVQYGNQLDANDQQVVNQVIGCGGNWCVIRNVQNL